MFLLAPSHLVEALVVQVSQQPAAQEIVAQMGAGGDCTVKV